MFLIVIIISNAWTQPSIQFYSLILQPSNKSMQNIQMRMSAERMRASNSMQKVTHNHLNAPSSRVEVSS